MCVAETQQPAAMTGGPASQVVIVHCNGCPVATAIMDLLSMKSGLLKRAHCSNRRAPFAKMFNVLKFAVPTTTARRRADFSAENEPAVSLINVHLEKDSHNECV